MVFQMVYDRSPDPVPFWGGESYKPIFTSFIPRAIYPAKPEERAGGEFGRRYGILQGNRARSSINIPWLTELLANFGTAGVFIGMGLFGVLLGFLDKTFNARGMTQPEFLIGITLIFPLVYPESNFTVMKVRCCRSSSRFGSISSVAGSCWDGGARRNQEADSTQPRVQGGGARSFKLRRAQTAGAPIYPIAPTV